MEKRTLKKLFCEGGCAAVLIASAAFTACGHKNGIVSANSNMIMKETAAAEAYEEGLMSDGYGAAMGTRLAMAMPAAENSDSGAADVSADTLQPTAQGRKLIRTVNLCVETREFDSLLASVQEQAAALGGYVERSDISGASLQQQNSSRYANLCVRIPADNLDRFLTSVSEAGNVTSRSESVDDVTLQYTDVESHKKSLEIEQERLWELMEQAQDVDAIIALEERLSEIRYQLESYESQLRVYDNQVNYSTVNLSLIEVRELTPATPDSFGDRIRLGFQNNLRLVCDTAVNFAVWLISCIPTLAVLAVLFLILAAFLRRLIRRLLNKQAKTPSETEDPHKQPDLKDTEKTDDSPQGTKPQS